MSKSWEERKVSLGGAIIAAAVTLALGFLVGMNWKKFSPYLGIEKSTNKQDWSALDDVYITLSSKFDGDLDKSELLEGAKKGLVAAAGDAYTEYMSPKEARDYEAYLDGDAGVGIGVEMALRDGYVKVLRTLPDNPAGRAGVKAGDIIYKIDGEEVYTLSTSIISTKLHGEAGTEVELTVVRDGKELSFKLKREKINNVSAYVEYDGHTAIITVLRFDKDTGKLVENLAKETSFAEKGVDSIILDLRNNGGGFVTAARDLVSLWVDGELIVTEKGKSVSSISTYATRGHAIFAKIPTVVLVNASTASASEIVAGALKDYNKATLVGEKTFGKGIVQTLFDLPDTSLLKVTTAKWYTPKNNNIHGEGIVPDKIVEMSAEDLGHGKDPQLDAAKKVLKK